MDRSADHLPSAVQDPKLGLWASYLDLFYIGCQVFTLPAPQLSLNSSCLCRKARQFNHRLTRTCADRHDNQAALGQFNKLLPKA
eukprot:1158645-Pelagomonas_calceolata.AAC.5